MAQQPGRSPAKYQLIAADLLARIGAGEYPVGSQLPTKPELIRHYGAALGTVDHALAELRRMGVAESRQGTGTFVLRQRAEAEERDAIQRQVAELRDEVRELADRIALEPGDLRATFERLELNLIDLYGKLGFDYPREGSEGEADRTVAHGNRAQHG